MSLREEGAMRIVNRHALYSAAVGLLPLPVVDLAAITAVQIKMLRDLSKHYDVPFQEDLGKSLVSSLLGGIVSTRLAWGAAGSFIKGLPVVGQILGFFTSPAFATASTFAVGKVFITHFESGGTFLDFNPSEVREHFASEFKNASAAGTETASAAKGKVASGSPISA